MNDITQSDEKDFITYTKESIGLIDLEINFKKLHEDAVIPSYAHDGDVGMDMTAISVEYDEKNDLYIYHTGLAFESPYNYGQFLFPRSSNRKTDAYLCNSVGIADSAIYRGEILFCYKNRESIESIAEREAVKDMMEYLSSCSVEHKFLGVWMRTAIDVYNAKKTEIYQRAKKMEFAPYKVGDRIGQMVFMNYPHVKLIQQNQLSETERGANGFGSTGN